MKYGSLNLLEPSGPYMDCFVFTFNFTSQKSDWIIFFSQLWDPSSRLSYRGSYFHARGANLGHSDPSSVKLNTAFTPPQTLMARYVITYMNNTPLPSEDSPSVAVCQQISRMLWIWTFMTAYTKARQLSLCRIRYTILVQASTLFLTDSL